MNTRSDVAAKAAFKVLLEREGYCNVRIVSAPADLCAEKDGRQYLFEIKVTAKSTTYFGAATITEWEAALKAPDYFRFVIARHVDGQWCFDRFSPAEFLRFSDIPPFKVYFRVPINGSRLEGKLQKPKRAVAATLENLRKLIAFREAIKREHLDGGLPGTPE
jgi:hypothetical protein